MTLTLSLMLSEFSKVRRSANKENNYVRFRFVQILNQDAAKTFLFKCDPGKLYDFFMRATQLADCKKDYATATEEKNSAEILVSEKRDALPTLKAEVSKWEKKYQVKKGRE